MVRIAFTDKVLGQYALPTRSHDLRNIYLVSANRSFCYPATFMMRNLQISSASELLDENLYHTKKTSDGPLLLLLCHSVSIWNMSLANASR